MTESCRIAFVLQDTGSIYGAERATLDLALGLQAYTPVEIVFVLIHETRLGTRKSLIEAELKAAGIRCLIVSTGQPFSLTLVQHLRAAFKECHADCVHSVGYKAVVHCALAGLLPRPRPWVSTVHGWLERRNIKERMYKQLELRALKQANKVIALSTYYRNLLAGFGFSQERLQLIPSGLRIDGWSPGSSSKNGTAYKGPVCIGILGRLSDEKNHQMFLRVAERLLKEKLPVRFLIAGDGPLKHSLDEQLQTSALREHMRMPGVMDRDAFFSQCDILVSCSRIENLPYSIMEAMACSLPVVATAVGGVPDIIIEGQTGNLVAVDDDDAMISRLRQLIHDPERARTLGSAAHRRVEEHFSLARSAERHFALYTEVIRQKVPGH